MAEHFYCDESHWRAHVGALPGKPSHCLHGVTRNIFVGKNPYDAFMQFIMHLNWPTTEEKAKAYIEVLRSKGADGIPEVIYA